MTSPVPHQAVYRRWRAQTFAQIVGQEAVVRTLQNAVRTDQVSHAILFVGPRGTGKTSLARIMAKAVNCTDQRDGDACDACPSCVSIREGTTLDLIEIDAASNRGIDDVRALRERLPYPPGQLRRKIYILDEAHQITPAAWNALLKSIEEPPDFVMFIFASTEPSGFPAAIRSRLQRYDVRRLTVSEIEGKLRRILDADGRRADDAAIRLIATLAAGGMRDAESMLDQLMSSASNQIDEAQVRDLLGLADAEVVDAFVDVLVRGDAPAGVALLDGLDERGRDIGALLDQVVDAIRVQLVAGLTDLSRARHDPAGLAAAGRRIAAIDPNRAGIGGLRFQLELALFRSASEHVGRVNENETANPTAAVRTGQVKIDVPARSSDASTSRTSGSTLREAQPSAQPNSIPKPPATLPAAESLAAESSAAESSAAAEAPSDSVTPRTRRSTRDEMAETRPVPPGLPAAHDPAFHGSALDELLVAWPGVVAALSLHPPTRPLILACRPVSVDGAIVTLGFPEEQAFLKDAAERRKSGIEAGISAALGRAIAVRCVVANVEVIATDSGDAAYVLAEARRIFADDLVDVGEIH